MQHQAETVKSTDTRVTVTPVTGWDLAKEMAMATMGRQFAKSPTSKWKSILCRCEHSPLRTVQFKIEFSNLPSYVSVHFVRHKCGIEHFVQSQRVDRSESHTPRHDLPQDAPVLHKMLVNAAEIIFISRRRLCSQASPETRSAWRLVIDQLRAIGETELADACVPECVYRGYCPEYRPCGFATTPAFTAALAAYRAPCATTEGVVSATNGKGAK